MRDSCKKALALIENPGTRANVKIAGKRLFDKIIETVDPLSERRHINPCSGIRCPTPLPKPKALGKQEVRMLKDSAKGTRLHALIIIAANTGLQYKDIINLRKGDFIVDDNGSMFLRGERKKTGVEYIIPLRKGFVKWFNKRFATKDPDDLLLRMPDTFPRKDWREVVSANDATKGAQFKHLRSTFATNLAKLGGSASLIQSCLGHSGIGMAQYYVRRECVVREFAALQKAF